MIPSNATPLFPFIDASSLLNQTKKNPPYVSPNEPIDLTKTFKRTRKASGDQPIDYSIRHKRVDSNLQHVSHVFGNNQEKRFKKDSEYSLESQIKNEHYDDEEEDDDDDDDDDEGDDENDDDHVHEHPLSLFGKKSTKRYSVHRPLTPISSSSSPQTLSLLEKKPIVAMTTSINDAQATMIRSRDRYCCSYCSKTFPRSANLTRHLRTHTDKYLR
jgi:hypothetical protein